MSRGTNPVSLRRRPSRTVPATIAAVVVTAVGVLLAALGRVAADPERKDLDLELRFRDFAEKEPIPLHAVAAARERGDNWTTGLKLLGLLLGLGLLVFFGRRALRRRHWAG